MKGSNYHFATVQSYDFQGVTIDKVAMSQRYEREKCSAPLSAEVSWSVWSGAQVGKHHPSITSSMFGLINSRAKRNTVQRTRFDIDESGYQPLNYLGRPIYYRKLLWLNEILILYCINSQNTQICHVIVNVYAWLRPKFTFELKISIKTNSWRWCPLETKLEQFSFLRHRTNIPSVNLHHCNITYPAEPTNFDSWKVNWSPKSKSKRCLLNSNNEVNYPLDSWQQWRF